MRRSKRSEPAGFEIEHVDETDEMDAGVIEERSFVVVATQGHYAEEALQRALATPAAYVGLIASRKRAQAVKSFLRDRGVPERRAVNKRCKRQREREDHGCCAVNKPGQRHRDEEQRGHRAVNKGGKRQRGS